MGYGDTFYINEVFSKIYDKQHYLWLAADQNGEVVDVSLQQRGDGGRLNASLIGYCSVVMASPERSLPIN